MVLGNENNEKHWKWVLDYLYLIIDTLFLH